MYESPPKKMHCHLILWFSSHCLQSHIMPHATVIKNNTACSTCKPTFVVQKCANNIHHSWSLISDVISYAKWSSSRNQMAVQFLYNYGHCLVSCDVLLVTCTYLAVFPPTVQFLYVLCWFFKPKFMSYDYTIIKIRLHFVNIFVCIVHHMYWLAC